MAKKSTTSKKTPIKRPGSRLKPTKAEAEAILCLTGLHAQVREILTLAKDRAWQAVNTIMVEAYWEVGRVIVEDEQAGKGRADYGKRVLEGLAQRLTVEFGKGFGPVEPPQHAVILPELPDS